jgi:hypothetical protein
LTCPFKQNALHIQVFNTKEARVKFKENIIIRCKTVNKNMIF